MDRIWVGNGHGKMLEWAFKHNKPSLRSRPNCFIMSFSRLSHWQLRKEPLKHMFPYGPSLKWGNKPVQLPFSQTNRKSRRQVRDFRNSCRENGQAVEARFSSSKWGFSSSLIWPLSINVKGGKSWNCKLKLIPVAETQLECQHVG